MKTRHTEVRNRAKITHENTRCIVCGFKSTQPVCKHCEKEYEVDYQSLCEHLAMDINKLIKGKKLIILTKDKTCAKNAACLFIPCGDKVKSYDEYAVKEEFGSLAFMSGYLRGLLHGIKEAQLIQDGGVLDGFDKLIMESKKLEQYQRNALVALYRHPRIKNEIGMADAFKVLYRSGKFEDFIEDLSFNGYGDYEKHVAVHVDQFVDIIRKMKR